MRSKSIIVFIFSLFVICGCSSGTQKIDPTPTNSPVVIPSPTVTPSPVINENLGLPVGTKASFSNGQEISFVEGDDNAIGLYFGTDYKKFPKVDTSETTVSFVVDGLDNSASGKLYCCARSYIYDGYFEYTNYSVDKKNNQLQVSFTYNEYIERLMFIFSLKNNDKTIFLPFYIGQEYIDKTVIKDFLVPVDEIDYFEYHSPYLDTPDGRIVEGTNNSDETKKAFLNLFSNCDLLYPYRSDPIPGDVMHNIKLIKKSGEVIEFTLSSYFIFDDHTYLLLSPYKYDFLTILER